LVEFEFEALVFVVGGNPERDPRIKTRTNKQLNPHTAPRRKMCHPFYPDKLDGALFVDWLAGAFDFRIKKLGNFY